MKAFPFYLKYLFDSSLPNIKVKKDDPGLCGKETYLINLVYP